MPPQIASFDHLVLTVTDLQAARRFYCGLLGMEWAPFTGADGQPRHALRFGAQKINLHQSGQEIAPHAAAPTPGSADFCLLSPTPLAEWLAHLQDNGVHRLTDIVPRSGATGPILSIYLRDPDGNLVEISNPA